MQAIQRIRLLEGVHVVKFDFCMLGMRTMDRHGNPSSARKMTTVMTNSPAVAKLLRNAQCRSEHQHTPLLGGKAGPCQEYTDQFCELICEGVRREKGTSNGETTWRRNSKETIANCLWPVVSGGLKYIRYPTSPRHSASFWSCKNQ